MQKQETVVFKVGTSTLTHENGKTNIRRMEELVMALSDLANAGRRIVLVTSGAIGVGVALDENGYVYLTQIFCR